MTHSSLFARSCLSFAAALSTVLALSGCGGNDAPSGSATGCTTADDCAAGQTCEAGVCTDDADGGTDVDAGVSDTGETTDTVDDAVDDTGADSGDVAEPDPDADAEDVDTTIDDATDTVDEPDTDAGSDVDDAVGEDAEDDTGGNPTLPDYLPCDADSDCPVGLGDCITEIPLNRTDSVLGSRVAIADLAPAWPADGVCSLSCTADASVCETLSLRDGAGRPVEFTCQLMVGGTAPYPELIPPFPFDDDLDPDELSAGVPFGAICRPPFELDATRSSAFCASCAGVEDCGGDDLCWSFSTGAPTDTSGMCLQPCSEDAACPLGFSCDEFVDGDGDDAVVLGTFCSPIEQTCSDCRDLDGDRRGAGRCGVSSSPVSEYDCDDFDANIYYASTDEEHPFPDFCGEFDYNCNGISDATEQVGADAYPVEHCTACGDVCEGVEPNATRQCRTDAGGEPFCAVVCDDAESFADCTPEPGCETPVSDPSRLFYRDADGDGAGDPEDVVFACELGEAPDGYVANSADCNDDNDTAYGAYGGTPAAVEVCDGVDNDCNDEIDEALLVVGDACSTGLDGVCASGTQVCMGVDGLMCVPDVAPGTVTEICDGADNDCDGDIDEEEDIPEIGEDCTADAPGVCALGTRICEGASGLTCEAGSPEPGVDLPDVDGTDSDCDGMDGDESRAIFVRPGARDGAAGTRADPVRTLEQAVSRLTSSRDQILMENGVYEDTSSVTISASSAVVGGYRVDTGGDWVRERSGRADVRFVTPNGGGNALGIRVNGSSSRRYLFMDLDVSVASEGDNGESVTGWACINCNQAEFVSVSIEAGNAVDGINGDPGDSGDVGTAGNNGSSIVGGPPVATACPGLSSSTAGRGGNGGFNTLAGRPENNGLPGVDGAGPLGGDGGAERTPERDGQAGGDGAPATTVARAADGGHNSGTPSSTAGSAAGVWWTRANGSSGGAGTNGGGGGGGSGGSASVFNVATYLLFGGGGGGGAAPGCRGEGGRGGAAGGSSIALWLESSDGVSFDDVALRSGNGGSGGAGGPGGVGGVGFAGGSGATAGGRVGGHGGASSGGSGGGGGGGGAGGSSYGVVRDGATSVDTSRITFTIGSAGSGGSGADGGMGGPHGNADLDDQSASGARGRDGADGEALQQRVR